MANDRAARERRIEEALGADLSPDGPADAPYHVAWAAHHAHSALESILERTARTLEGGLPDGADRHRALLSAAFLEISGPRPAILSRALAPALNDLRGIRQFVRLACDGDLDLAHLALLQARLRILAPGLARDLDSFDAFLGQVAAGSGTRPWSPPGSSSRSLAMVQGFR